MQHDLLCAISNRFTTRSFSDRQISKDDFEAVLEAGIVAPSSKNRQPWKYYVVKDEDIPMIAGSMGDDISKQLEVFDSEDMDKNDLLSAMRTMRIIGTSKKLVVVCYCDRSPYKGVSNVNWSGDISDRELVDILSIGASIENILLEATSRGIGTLWVGDFLYAYDTLGRVTGIEDRVVSLIAFGYPSDGMPSKRNRRDDRVTYL